MTTGTINLLPKEEKKRDVRSTVLNVFLVLIIIMIMIKANGMNAIIVKRKMMEDILTILFTIKGSIEYWTMGTCRLKDTQTAKLSM